MKFGFQICGNFIVQSYEKRKNKEKSYTKKSQTMLLLKNVIK